MKRARSKKGYFEKQLGWFHLSRYAKVRAGKLSLLEWFEQIAARRYVLKLLGVYSDFLDLAMHADGIDNMVCLDFLEKIKKDPIVNLSDLMPKYEDSDVLQPFTDYALQTRLQPAQPTTVEEVFLWQALAEPSLVENAGRFYRELINFVRGCPPSGLEYPISREFLKTMINRRRRFPDCQVFFETDAYGQEPTQYDERFGNFVELRDALNKVIISLDLEFSNAEIIRQVERMLPILRGRQRARPARKFNTALWAKCSVLAYADLQIWHRFECLPLTGGDVPRLPPRVIYDKIYREYIKAGETVPSRTASYFKSLFLCNDEDFRQLQVHIAKEGEFCIMRYDFER